MCLRHFAQLSSCTAPLAREEFGVLVDVADDSTRKLIEFIRERKECERAFAVANDLVFTDAVPDKRPVVKNDLIKIPLGCRELPDLHQDIAFEISAPCLSLRPVDCIKMQSESLFFGRYPGTHRIALC
jgi:hypothetical protein